MDLFSFILLLLNLYLTRLTIAFKIGTQTSLNLLLNKNKLCPFILHENKTHKYKFIQILAICSEFTTTPLYLQPLLSSSVINNRSLKRHLDQSSIKFEISSLSSTTKLFSISPLQANGNSTVKPHWTSLFDGTILKQIQQDGEGFETPKINNNVTIEFTISRLNNQLLMTNNDLGISMLEFPMIGVSPGFREALITMKRLEKSIFLMSPLAHGLNGKFIGSEHIGINEWLKFEIEMCNFLHWNEQWNGFDPQLSTSLLPQLEKTELSSEEEVEIKSDLLMKQLEDKMTNNFSSPHWDDIKYNLQSSHYSTIDEHLSRESNNISNPMLASRGYRESIQSSKIIDGYNIGQRMEGRSKNYIWRETPYIIELLFPIDDILKSKEIDCIINENRLKIYLKDKKVFDDELIGEVFSRDLNFCVINRQEMIKPKFSSNESQLHFSPLKQTKPCDNFESLEKVTCLHLLLHKKGNPQFWGNIFKSL